VLRVRRKGMNSEAVSTEVRPGRDGSPLSQGEADARGGACDQDGVAGEALHCLRLLSWGGRWVGGRWGGGERWRPLLGSMLSVNSLS